MKISVVRDILEANDRIAQQNRALFNENNLLVIKGPLPGPRDGYLFIRERKIYQS